MNVNLNDEPGGIGPELNNPVFDVQVCVVLSSLVTVTVVPAAITSGDGRNWKFRMARRAAIGVVVVVGGEVVVGDVAGGDVTNGVVAGAEVATVPGAGALVAVGLGVAETLPTAPCELGVGRGVVVDWGLLADFAVFLIAFPVPLVVLVLTVGLP